MIGVPGAGVWDRGEPRNDVKEEVISDPFGLRASAAARSNKLVVPVAFVEPDLAEHTRATRLLSLMYLLY